MQIDSSGNIYTPGFSMSNGVLTINTLDVIGTAHIKGNAVTVPVTAFDSSVSTVNVRQYSSTNFDTGPWVQLGQATIDASGGSIFIFFSCDYEECVTHYMTSTPAEFFESWPMQLRVTSSTGADITFYSSAISWTEFPGVGSHTYTVYMRAKAPGASGGNIWKDGKAWNKSLLLLGVKR